MNVTDRFLSKTSQLKLMQEVTNSAYQMFNSGSTEMEVGEFLYSLVRLVKPERILETGTHYGISAAYMAQGLKDNGRSCKLETLEVIQSYKDHATSLWRDLDLSSFVYCWLVGSMDFTYPPGGLIDILFLDSEPQFRFDEFVKFWPNVRPGGFILIHDLHPHLGHTGITHHGVMDWPYGDFRAKLSQFIKPHDVQTVSFPSPRGFTMFQKVGLDFGANRLLKGEI